MSSFGDEIRRERELREFSLRDVAEATKINLRYLQALEVNDFEYLPGGVFNRGFVRAYSEFIGVDPESMVNAYLLEEQSQKGPALGQDPQVMRRRPSIGEPELTTDRADSASRKAQARFVRWILLVVALVVVALASIWLLGLLPFQGQETNRPVVTTGSGDTPGPSPGVPRE